jgi:hypothetical protein
MLSIYGPIDHPVLIIKTFHMLIEFAVSLLVLLVKGLPSLEGIFFIHGLAHFLSIKFIAFYILRGDVCISGKAFTLDIDVCLYVKELYL